MVFGLTNQATAQQDGRFQELIEQARVKGIEASSLNDLVRRSENRSITDAELYAVIERAVRMAEQNLPTEAALGKALEGISKEIPFDRIESLMNDIEISTERSAAVVDPWLKINEVKTFVKKAPDASAESFRGELVQVVARGLRNRVDDGTFQSLLNDISGNDKVLTKTSPDRVIAGISVISELPGNAAEQAHIARSVIVKALESNFTPSDLQQLPVALHQAQQKSQLPASSVLAGLSKQVGAGVGPAALLKNLFNGKIGGGPPGDIPIGVGGKPGFVGSNMGS